MLGDDAVIQVGGVARLDALEVLLDELLVDDPPGRHHHVNLLLESDDGEDVGRLQQVDDVTAGALDVVERLAFHGAAAVDQGLAILRDWAGDVTLDPTEIEKERGVVMEEWRLGRGAGRRIFDKQSQVVFKGSKYAQRIPIGKTSLEAFLEVYNAFNRGNDCCRQVSVTQAPDDTLHIQVRQKTWLSIVPLAGIDYRF